jgi:hypothetical protein
MTSMTMEAAMPVSYSQGNVVAEPATKSFENEYSGRSEIVSEISRNIVFKAALGDVLEGDRLTRNDATLPVSAETVEPKQRGFIGKLTNAVIRGAEGVTGIAQARILDNQMRATRALEIVHRHGVNSLDKNDIKILKKLGLSRYLTQEGSMKLREEIRAAREIKNEARLAGAQVEEKKGKFAWLTSKFNAANESYLRDMYLKNVSLENEKKGVKVTNIRLGLEVTAFVAAAIGTKLSAPLQAASIAAYAGLRTYQRSMAKTEKMMQEFRTDGTKVPEAQRYASGQGVNQTLAWSMVKGAAQSVGKFYSADMRLRENKAVKATVEAGDINVLAERMRSGDKNAALEILARAGSGTYYNDGGNIVEVSKIVKEARALYEAMGNGREEALVNTQNTVLAYDSAMRDTRTVEVIKDVKRAMVTSIVALGLKDILLHGANAAMAAERPAILSTSENAKKLAKDFIGSQKQVKAPVDPIDPAEDPKTYKLYMPLVQNGNGNGSDTPDTSPLRYFTLDSKDAKTIAESGNAMMLHSRDTIYSNVFGYKGNRPDFEVRTNFGKGDGILTAPSDKNLELTITGKYHEKAQLLLANKKLISANEYKPQNMGYRLYVKNPDGSNSGIVVTQDSNIEGITVTAEGKLIVAPSYHTKIDGIANVYVDKDASGSVKHIYNIGNYKVANPAGHGKPDFVVNDFSAKGQSLPQANARVESELTPDINENGLDTVSIDSAEANIKLINAKSQLIPMDRVTEIDKATVDTFGKIMVDGNLRRSYSINGKDVLDGLHFSMSEDEVTYLGRVKKVVEETVDKNIGTISPKNLKWAVVLKDSKGNLQELVVDKDSRILGIKVTDQGLYLDAELGARAVEINRLVQTGSRIIEVDEMPNIRPTGNAPLLVTLN